MGQSRAMVSRGREETSKYRCSDRRSELSRCARSDDPIGEVAPGCRSARATKKMTSSQIPLLCSTVDRQRGWKGAVQAIFRESRLPVTAREWSGFMPLYGRTIRQILQREDGSRHRGPSREGLSPTCQLVHHRECTRVTLQSMHRQSQDI